MIDNMITPNVSVGYCDQGMGHGHYALLVDGEPLPMDREKADFIVRACNSYDSTNNPVVTPESQLTVAKERITELEAQVLSMRNCNNCGAYRGDDTCGSKIKCSHLSEWY